MRTEQEIAERIAETCRTLLLVEAMVREKPEDAGARDAVRWLKAEIVAMEWCLGTPEADPNG